MAVYTEVSDKELIDFVGAYDIGDVVSFKGIAEGVENSNYLLQTTQGPYILTLYEKRVRASDLPYFIGFMEHLAAQGVACPTPLHGNDGAALRTLCGRPAAIITFLEGLWPRRIQPHHCAELGTALAYLHVAGAEFTLQRKNSLSVKDTAVRLLLRAST
jgi:homoserine kinase type II